MSLSIWTVYDHPRDYPDGYIARRFVLDRPTADVLVAVTLEELRTKLPEGLTRIERSPDDDPVILEVWL